MKPKKIIDIHSHMFNLKYLPVAGILVRLSKKIIRHRVAIGIEWYLLRKTKSDFETEDKLQPVTYRGQDAETPVFQILGIKSINYTPPQLMNLSDDELIEAICNMSVKADFIDTLLSEAIEDFCADRKGPVEKLKYRSGMSESEEIAWLTNIRSWLKEMLDWIIKTFNKIRYYFKWFKFMTNSEITIFEYLRKQDGKLLNENLHLMMDVEGFFNNESTGFVYKPYFDFETEQIPNMVKLHQYAKGSLTGFVAFNPQRANWKDIIDKAINNYGFKGVKFYPPLGYKADGDAIYGTVISDFLDYCENHQIPILTHCNCEGFEAHPETNSGYNSNPVYWERALLKRKNLILCFGHGGGAEGWFTDIRPTDKVKPDEIDKADIVDKSEDQEKNWNNSYAAMVFKLCCKYPNVYCDASYLDSMIRPQGGFNQQAELNFRTRLVNLFNSEKIFQSKVLYGSDWHMLFNEGINYVYLNDYIQFFDHPDFATNVDHIFYNNAYQFIK